MGVAQKMELLKLFASVLAVGIVPAKHVVQVRISRNAILKGVDKDEANSYLERKTATDLSLKQKTESWISSGGKTINAQYASSTSSRVSGRRLFGDYQESLVREATKNLSDSAGISAVDEAIQNDAKCQQYGLRELFTRLQIKDKFKNIKKKTIN